eukprot:TRINITY_DN25402_c0_g2_i1.p1 TRINITY_DN25402_c0_g2~~TRINITY_DN25402_c0_g2_i1.p1  ORF type:complete len:297 (+),score=48.11 TRINITY_DN25402_c0_g2_i1:67-957(+)
MDLFGSLKTGLAQCLLDVPPPEDDGLTIGSSVFDDLCSYPDCKVTLKRRVGNPDPSVRADERRAEPSPRKAPYSELSLNAQGLAAARHQSHGAEVRLETDLAHSIQQPELDEVSHCPATADGEQQFRICEDLVWRPTGASRDLLDCASEQPAMGLDCWQEFEQWAMTAEDSAASCWREVSNRQGVQSFPDFSCDEDENLGRIILDARLTCKDAQGVDTLLEHNRLRLHLRQRNVDAARDFLKEQNCLKPVLVERYLEPLTAWLGQHVASAMTFPPGGIQVAGDLDAIQLEAELHRM